MATYFAPLPLPGHAAWIDGDWKLHRIADQQAEISWELYHLTRDPREQHDVKDGQTERVTAMREAMEAWLKSVTRSLNGADYALE